jgi:hypothetical protein
MMVATDLQLTVTGGNDAVLLRSNAISWLSIARISSVVFAISTT